MLIWWAGPKEDGFINVYIYIFLNELIIFSENQTYVTQNKQIKSWKYN